MPKCRVCNDFYDKETSPTWANEVSDIRCSECRRKEARNNRQHWHDRAIKMLGGKCKECGFDDFRALQIDHIAGGGSKRDTKGVIRNTRLYRLIVRDPEFRKTVQCLCANHNWIKKYNNGEGVYKDRF